MTESIDSLDVSLDLNILEKNPIPVNCWEDICLSNIWIPSHLLPSRKQPSNGRTTKGIFHTLEKYVKCIESFSVYSEEEIFLSDLDEDIFDHENTEKYEKKLPENILCVNTSCDTSTSKILNTNYDKRDILIDKSNHCKSEQYEYPEVKKRIPSMKTMPSVGNLSNIDVEMSPKVKCHEVMNVKLEYHQENISNHVKEKDSHISLHDILDSTPQFNINDFKTRDNEFFNIPERNLESNQRKNNKRKKTSKHVTLDKFLEDYKEEDYQNDCCNDYFRKLLQKKNEKDGVEIKSTAEFPNLVPKNLNFIHSEKLETKYSEPNLKTLSRILNQSKEINENANIYCNEQTATAMQETESICGKFVIENIPNEVSKDDIRSFLFSYGELKSFILESSGEFFKAHVEIDSTCDIDWIIECLNGTEPFGASTRTVNCYKEE